MAKLLLVLLLPLVQVCTSYKLQLTPEEASKISKRDLSEHNFNSGTGNFVTGAVNVPKRLPAGHHEKSVRTIDDIKRDLVNVWRELHSATSQVEHHSVLPKKEVAEDKSTSSGSSNVNRKREASDTNVVSVKTSEEVAKSRSRSAKELQETSQKMEKLEGVVDNLLRELESEQDGDSKATKLQNVRKSASSDVHRLQNDIDKLTKLSMELKRSSSRDEQKLNGIGREVQTMNSKNKLEATKREGNRLLRMAALIKMLNKKRSMGGNVRSTDDRGPPKFNGIGREIHEADALRKLISSYVQTKRSSAQISQRAAPPMPPMDQTREAMILKTVSALMNKKRSENAFAENSRQDSRRSTLSSLLANVLSSNKRERNGPPMLPMDSRENKFALLKRVLNAIKGDKGFSFFKKSGGAEELKATNDNEERELADLRRRVRLYRLLDLYKKSIHPNRESAEYELARAASEKFPVDTSRFTSNQVENSATTSRSEGNSVGTDLRGNNLDLESLLETSSDGSSHQTTKSLEGFHKAETRDVSQEKKAHNTVSDRTASTLLGFSN